MLTMTFGGILVAALFWFLWEKSRRQAHPVPPGLQKDIELPHSSEFELYHNALSLCSMKARVCMAELQVPYRSHHIDLIETGSYETISRAFLSVNPGGTVPVLVHNGCPVYESHEQIRYAALHAPPGSPALVPEDPDLRAQMEYWIDRSSITDDPLNQGELSIGNAIPPLTFPLFATMMERIPMSKVFDGLLFHPDRRRPVLFLALKLVGIHGMHYLPPLTAFLERSRVQVGEHLDQLEEQLKREGPWILGACFSLADVSWLVIFERLMQTDYLHLYLGGGRRPACATYWERLQARPAYREAILGYPHPLITYGTRRIEDAKAADPSLRAYLGG